MHFEKRISTQCTFKQNYFCITQQINFNSVLCAGKEKMFFCLSKKLYMPLFYVRHKLRNQIEVFKEGQKNEDII